MACFERADAWSAGLFGRRKLLQRGADKAADGCLFRVSFSILFGVSKGSLVKTFGRPTRPGDPS